MKIFYAVGVILFVVIIYFFSALTPLPWYLYLPFIVLFGLAFYWDRLAKYIPWDTTEIFNRYRRTSAGRKKTGHSRGKRI